MRNGLLAAFRNIFLTEEFIGLLGVSRAHYTLVGHRHFFQNNSPKRKRGIELGTIPRLRFGLQKRLVSAKTGAVQLNTCWNSKSLISRVRP